MSGNFFDSYTSIWWVETRDAAKHTIMHRTAPHNKDVVAQDVNSAEVEKHWANLKGNLLEGIGWARWIESKAGEPGWKQPDRLPQRIVLQQHSMLSYGFSTGMDKLPPTVCILLTVQNLRREHLINLPCHLAKGRQCTLNEGSSSKGSTFISKHFWLYSYDSFTI